eukprot:Hpha_TRINITY_DN15315_c4_g2::TRINITY_DN15315_c4_g2_i1::g.91359::m.91359
MQCVGAHPATAAFAARSMVSRREWNLRSIAPRRSSSLTVSSSSLMVISRSLSAAPDLNPRTSPLLSGRTGVVSTDSCSRCSRRRSLASRRADRARSSRSASWSLFRAVISARRAETAAAAWSVASRAAAPDVMRATACSTSTLPAILRRPSCFGARRSPLRHTASAACASPTKKCASAAASANSATAASASASHRRTASRISSAKSASASAAASRLSPRVLRCRATSVAIRAASDTTWAVRAGALRRCRAARRRVARRWSMRPAVGMLASARCRNADASAATHSEALTPASVSRACTARPRVADSRSWKIRG